MTMDVVPPVGLHPPGADLTGHGVEIVPDPADDLRSGGHPEVDRLHAAAVKTAIRQRSPWSTE